MDFTPRYHKTPVKDYLASENFRVHRFKGKTGGGEEGDIT